jgi:N-sulfoglucosamine sulfohydrolase
MTRRQASSLLAAPALQAAQQKLPNLLLVLSDDHARPHLGCMGDPLIRTPHLDRFASQGMKMTRMFTAAPQCVPSRAALLTGRSPVAARMGRFASPLPPDVKTLPEVLRTKGYFTGVCRRYFHLDGQINPSELTKEIYDRHGMQTWDTRMDFVNRNAPRAQTIPIMNEFLDKAGQKPWFFWINFNDPHHVWDRNAIPTPHDPAKIPLPPHLPDLPGLRDDLARYYDEIARMDEEFSFIMANLERRGLADNTLVIFLGDNGHAFPHGKGSLYDPGLNVPCIARWPGRIKPGGASNNLLSGEDITPTFLDAAGLSPLKEMSGRSFLPLLTGSSQYKARDFIFAGRFPHGNSSYTEKTKAATFDLSRCARDARYKLIWNYTPYQEYVPVDSANDAGWREMVAAHEAGKLSPEIDKAYFTRPRPVVQLFDLDKDPGELNNVAGRPEYAEAENRLKRALQEKMVTDYDFLPPPFDENTAPPNAAGKKKK